MRVSIGIQVIDWKRGTLGSRISDNGCSISTPEAVKVGVVAVQLGLMLDRKRGEAGIGRQIASAASPDST